MVYGQYLVIDYGTTYIKGMLFKNSLGSVTILRSEKLSIVHLKGNEEDEYEYNLVRFIQSFFPEEKTFLLNIPTEKIIIRDLQVPFGVEKTVMEVMTSEVETVIPFPIETMSIQGTIWKLSEQSSNVITFSAHETDIIHAIEPLLKQEEVQVKSIYSDLSSLAAVVKESHQKLTNYSKEGQLDLGGKVSIFNACSEGKHHHSRYFFEGGHTLSKKIAQELDLSIHEAEELKISLEFHLFEEIESEKKKKERFLREFNLNEQDLTKIKELIEVSVDRIVTEIRRSLQILPNELTPEVIHLSGGAASFAGIEKLLSEKLQIKVRKYDFLQIDDLNFVNCLGASYQQKFKQTERVDFLNEKMARKINVNTFQFSRFRIHLTLTTISLIILLTVFLVGIIIDKKKLQKNELALIKKFEKGFRKKLPEGRDPSAYARELVRKEKKKSEIVRLFLNKDNILDLIHELTDKFPEKESVDFILDQFTFNGSNDQIQLYIRVPEFSDIGILQKSLERSNKFQKVEIQNKNLRQGAKKYKVSFKFKLELKNKKEKK